MVNIIQIRHARHPGLYHADAAGHGAQVVFKNISATKLDFSAEEISDRFVRGDRSRNTEGSGLGLAIAKLCRTAGRRSPSQWTATCSRPR